MIKVLVTDGMEADGKAILQENNLEVTSKKGLTLDQLTEELASGEYHALVVRGSTKLPAEVLAEAKNLEVIGRQGSGVDTIDVEAASQHGIYVMNTPGSNRHGVKEMVFAALYHVMNRPDQLHDLTVNSGKSIKEIKKGKMFSRQDLYGKTIGIIGLGYIGFEVAELAKAHGMHVFGFDLSHDAKEKAKQEGITVVEEISDLFAHDIVSIHVPFNEKTKNLIQKQHLDSLKKGAILINDSRAGIVDEQLVYETLLQRIDRPFYFVTDVPISDENKPVQGTIPPVLLEKGLVLVSPHAGASTFQSENMGSIEMAKQLIDFFEKKIVRNAVNTPKIDAEALPYMDLAKKMGYLGRQFLGQVPSLVEVTLYNGAEQFSSNVRLGVFAGLLQEDEPLSFPTAAYRAKKAGIVYEERIPIEGKLGLSAYKNAMTLDVIANHERISIRGRILPEGTQEVSRISRLKDMQLITQYDVSFKVQGYLVFVEINQDTRGTFAALAAHITMKHADIRSSDHTVAKDGSSLMILQLDKPISLSNDSIHYVTPDELTRYGAIKVRTTFSASF